MCALPRSAKAAAEGGNGERSEDPQVLALDRRRREKSAETLPSSRTLARLVVPVYWKDGLGAARPPPAAHEASSFLRSFEKEFPDGQVRWDPD